MNSPTSNQHMERLLLGALDAITRNDMAPWTAMFAEDGIMEFPFAPPGSPQRVAGKEALKAYLAAFPDMIKLTRIHPVTFHHGDQVMVAEFSTEGVATQTGNVFTQRYVSVIEYRDGHITHYQDYWNPLVAQVALGH